MQWFFQIVIIVPVCNSWQINKNLCGEASCRYSLYIHFIIYAIPSIEKKSYLITLQVVGRSPAHAALDFVLFACYIKLGRKPSNLLRSHAFVEHETSVSVPKVPEDSLSKFLIFPFLLSSIIYGEWKKGKMQVLKANDPKKCFPYLQNLKLDWSQKLAIITSLQRTRQDSIFTTILDMTSKISYFFCLRFSTKTL